MPTENSKSTSLFRPFPVGIIPKKDSNKYKTITNLSSSEGLSVNELIPHSESTVNFNQFDSTAKIVAKLGKGALMSTLDIKSTF